MLLCLGEQCWQAQCRQHRAVQGPRAEPHRAAAAKVKWRKRAKQRAGTAKVLVRTQSYSDRNRERYLKEGKKYLQQLVEAWQLVGNALRKGCTAPASLCCHVCQLTEPGLMPAVLPTITAKD